MPMPKKANGANFEVSGGELTVRFDAGGVPVVYVVCIWGPKPQFGGQRPKVWCTEKLTSTTDGDTVTVPAGMAMEGAQITWSGGLIAQGESQGRLQVTLDQEGGRNDSFSYEFSFSAKNETETFYDGLNFVAAPG
ncbi:MAG TPA: hypothetical protein VLS49_16325 [Usitatibacter sp.]|nr:hypothetical protein [Usitatibacter sp.]